MNERHGNRRPQAGRPWAAWALAGIGLLAVHGAAWAQAAIRAVSASIVGGTEVVRIETSAPLPGVPAGFAIQMPPRIALDFPATTNATGRSLVEVNQGNLRSVHIIEAGERTRVVLNLNRPVPYEARAEGHVLLVTLQPAVDVAQAGVARAPTWAGAAMPAGATAALADIDFRRGEDGAGRIIVQLGSAQTPVDIQPQGRNIVVEFQRTLLPEGLRRRLDVTDYGTPVRMVTATQAGDRVRLLVENTGEWEHSAYQSDHQFVLEVRPLKPDPHRLVQGPKYSGERLSLNFQNIDVRALLQVFADFTGFNIVTTDTVQGNLTLRLKDVPWDQALDIILEAKQLGMTRSGNVIRVATKKELDEEALARREVGKKLEELEPLRTEVFRLNFAKAKEVADTLNQRNATGGAATTSTGAAAGTANRMLSPRGSAMADERTNQVFVTDIAARLEVVRDYIRRVDMPKKQVMIQARIVEATEGFGKALGVRLGGADLRAIRGGTAGYGIGGGNRLALGATYNAISLTTGESVNSTTQNPQFGQAVVNNNGTLNPAVLNTVNTSFVNLPAAPLTLTGATPASIALSLFSPSSNRFLNLELSALEADKRGRIISSPRLVTGELTKSTIKQGDQLKLILPGGTDAAPRVETVDANLQLEVEPQITPEGRVLLKLKITKNRVVSLTNAGANLSVKEINTEVMVENGGTVMIGGIYEQTETSSVDKVPVMGDVPVLGNLFKTRSQETAKTETLVFITPVVLVDGVEISQR